MKPEAIRQEIDNSRARGGLKQIQIPPCPDALIQLYQAMSQAEPDIHLVGRIAASDVAMSATLLRTANSPLFKPVGLPCTTVGQAMSRIGLQATVAVMMGFLVTNAIPVNSPHLARFWQRSTKRAVAMAFIASHLPPGSPQVAPGLAHTFGLFLHVGMPVLLQSTRGYGSTMVEAGARIDRSFIATENANHRTDHAVVGALVVRVWNMPAELMSAIRLHHDFDALRDRSISAEVRTLVAAGLLAEHLMRMHEGLSEDADWALNRDAALDWLQLSAEGLGQWEQALQPLLDEA